MYENHVPNPKSSCDDVCKRLERAGERGEVVTLARSQNFYISTNCGPAKVAEKKEKKLTCMTFLCMIALRDKTVEHTFLPGKIFEIQKFCYHGNVMSHISII